MLWNIKDIAKDSVTAKIISVQIVMFGMTVAVGGVEHTWTPSKQILYNFGAAIGPEIAHGELWRLFMPIFLHANVEHLILNAVVQMRLSRQQEKLLGSRKFAALYFMSGVCGNLFSAAFDPVKLSVGSSTCGFGLIGANYAQLLPVWDKLSLCQRLGSSAYVVMLVGANLSSRRSADMMGHLGGFLTGFVLKQVFTADSRISPSRRSLPRSTADANRLPISSGSTPNGNNILTDGTGGSVLLVCCSAMSIWKLTHLHLLPVQARLVAL
eukprot:TRINITY_DN115152_c0_g1_i1.p1 TRINITY_DN115152_c0_g1~~TRINITY_DN115152_c0_g1_i1.p1  ORF type:complete len:312 (+),score=26.75 TRINITY_DN115152_c0_g1_i1:135-938(+)